MRWIPKSDQPIEYLRTVCCSMEVKATKSCSNHSRSHNLMNTSCVIMTNNWRSVNKYVILLVWMNGRDLAWADWMWWGPCDLGRSMPNEKCDKLQSFTAQCSRTFWRAWYGCKIGASQSARTSPEFPIDIRRHTSPSYGQCTRRTRSKSECVGVEISGASHKTSAVSKIHK